MQRGGAEPDEADHATGVLARLRHLQPRAVESSSARLAPIGTRASIAMTAHIFERAPVEVGT